MRLQNPDGVNEAWRHPDRLRTAPFWMIGGIHYVGNLDVSSHLISTREGLVLVDTGFATTVPLLIESIRSLGFSERDVELILITHGHEDHAGGARRMKEATGAPVAIHAGDVETVEQGTDLTCGYYIYGVEAFEAFEVDRVLNGGEVLQMGNTEIRVHHTPGHTPGCCSYEIPAMDGDGSLSAFLFGGPGQWTFKRANRSQGYEGDMMDYARTLDYLARFDVQVPLGAHPGQNRALEKRRLALETGYSPNPFVDPAHWSRFLADLRGRFESLLRTEYPGLEAPRESRAI
jgi:metallo-beta-lactamase class B